MNFDVERAAAFTIIFGDGYENEGVRELNWSENFDGEWCKTSGVLL